MTTITIAPVQTLNGAIQLQLKIRRCPNRAYERFHKAHRPEAEGRWALPHHEFGLDIIAWVGALRYQHHRSGVAEGRDELIRDWHIPEFKLVQ